MKRSEAKQLLNEYLNFGIPIEDMVDVENLMTFLETKIGMMPPTVYLTGAKVVRNWEEE